MLEDMMFEEDNDDSIKLNFLQIRTFKMIKSQ